MNTLRRIAPWCFALALIVYLRPYTGIRHDATLYLAQALRVISPDVFNRDLFFVAGSQADFTVFPQLLAALLRYFPAGDVFLAFTFFTRLCFYAASWYLIRVLFPGKMQWPAVFSLIVMPTGYGSYSIFAYAEPFLTARPIAEALSLIALGLLIRRHSIWAIIALGIAGGLHPLQALGAAIVAWCWLVMQDRRWLWALLAAIPVCILGIAKVGPFSGLFTMIDPDWMELLLQLSDNIFLSHWEVRDWCIVVTDFYLVYRLSRCVPIDSPLSTLCKAVMAAFAVGLTLSLLLADMLQLALPAGAQFWRVLWVVHWFAMAGLPWVLWDQWQRQPKDWVAIILMVAIVGTGASVSRTTLPWAVLGLIPLSIAWPYVSAKVGRSIRGFMLVGLIAILVVALFRYQFSAWLVFKALGSSLERVRQDVVILGYPLIAGSLVALLAWIYSRSGRNLGAALGVLSLIALGGAVYLWDSRSPWSRVVEVSAGQDVFGEHVPLDSTVYWYSAEPSPLGPWLVLGRASYFNIFQMAGQVFNRGTSFAGIQRQLQIGPVNVQGEICDTVNAVNGEPDSCWIGDAGLRYMCTPYKDVAAPDYFVLPFRQTRHVRGTWEARHPDTGELLGSYYLYKCSDWGDPSGKAHIDRQSWNSVSVRGGEGVENE
ncbi:hypothetical protein MOQ21_10955 [Stenotrophomonas maltophilia]|nr:hypothetical protein [Stenotrophomonas geniculata]MCI1091831.1 hypothetical protein [Stenotrophomonas maltophilia]MCI1128339.1 hypothetical protein [Stenotrophomonas maltophilia]